MQELDQPDDPGDLWRARGDEVSAARPLMQGDVILLEGGPVCVVTHPCSMRRGPVLHKNQMVAAINNNPNNSWKGNFDWMPLSGVGLAGLDHPAANLRVLRSELTTDLQRARRVAAMSDVGIHLLQQRLACHLTRIVIGLSDLDEHSAPLLAECELIEDWVEELGSKGESALEALLDADDRKLRGWLEQARTRPQAMRAARKALLEQISES